MWIVAIAWIYVVVLMAATEPTVVAGIMTFAFYCALPLSILFYITGARRRRVHRQTQQPRRSTDARRESPSDDMDDGGGDGD
jgi:membrane protein implicated in regulation of membrane protease activity